MDVIVESSTLTAGSNKRQIQSPFNTQSDNENCLNDNI